MSSRLGWCLVASAAVIALAACKRSPADPVTITRDPTTPSAASSHDPTAAPSSPPSEEAWRTCGENVAKPPASYGSVREVDWCNWNYLGGLATVSKGRAELHEYEEMGGPHDTDLWSLGSVAFGDLDGDGNEDAAIVLDHESHFAKGGNHSEGEVFAYAIRKGAVVALARTNARVGSVAHIESGRLLLGPGGAKTGTCVHVLSLDAGKLVTKSDSCADLE